MARDLTAEELAMLREHLKAARTPNPTTQMTYVLTVLDMLVEVMGGSADLTLRARKRFDETTGKTS